MSVWLRRLKLAALGSMAMTVVYASDETRVHVFADARWQGLQLVDNCRMGLFGVLDDRIILPRTPDETHLRFALDDGEVGTCGSDAQARHGAAFWERTELKQLATLRRDATYDLRFAARFDQGFTGALETFWQLHSWVRGCPTGPALRLSFDDGRLNIRPFVDGGYAPPVVSDVRIEDLKGTWQDIQITFGTGTQNTVEVRLNETPVLATRFDLPVCGTPFVKFGIYRPAATPGQRNVTSVWDLGAMMLRDAE